MIMFWLVFASSKHEMIGVLTAAAIPGDIAGAIHSFSVSEVFWTVSFTVGAFFLVTLIVSRAVNRTHGMIIGALLVLLLAIDLGRANRFWIVYYDYKNKYASNPIIEALRENSYERRVSSTLNPFAPSSLSNENGAFFGIIANSWLQHQFPYFDIQSLDVVQMPRPQIMDLTFGSLFVPQNVQEGYKYTRLWELTSTRYLLGMTGYVAVLNQQFDHSRDRFKILSRFNFVPKGGGAMNAVKVDDLTAQVDPAGSFGVIEFTGALPKVKRYSQWIVNTNEQETLRKLADLQFDPSKQLIVMDESIEAQGADVEDHSGTASIESYRPKNIRVKTTGANNGVLLLNDRYHHHWNVYVDGGQKPLLRCNYIMRGVEVPAGDHVVEFRYEPPQTGFAISLASIFVGGVIVCFIGTGQRRRPSEQVSVSSAENDQSP